jgi:hypothetical protein
MEVTARNLKFVYFVLYLLMDKRKAKERERERNIHKKKIVKKNENDDDEKKSEIIKIIFTSHIHIQASLLNSNLLGILSSIWIRLLYRKIVMVENLIILKMMILSIVLIIDIQLWY